MNYRSVVFLFLILLGCVDTATAQKKFSIVSGSVHFTSNAELELIKARSDKVAGLIDPDTRQFAFTIDIKSFRGFNSELQREHFNEKYMESERFPTARFSGKIIEEIDLTQNASYEVRAKGELDIHGQKQTRIIKSKITITNGVLRVESNFVVPLTDHNISIPNIVSQKIATEIQVDFSATMSVK